MELLFQMNHYTAGYHAWSKDLQSAKLWYFAMIQFYFSCCFSPEPFFLGGRHQPIYEATSHETISHHFRSTPEIACLRADGRFPEDRKSWCCALWGGIENAILVIGRPSSAIAFPLYWAGFQILIATLPIVQRKPGYRHGWGNRVWKDNTVRI